ncbi:MAG TPA: MBL fold metallo-hydrolase [Thermoanaerobaculia bacterium]|nr:MBL fold metallo-hydrolase [Thermoanaerobaculia bacterium]
MRRAVKAMIAVGSAAAAATAAERRLVAAPRYRGPLTDHFDGERFFNPNYVRQREGAAFLKWMLNREQGVWSKVEGAYGPPPPRRVADGELRVTFVNHATTLLQLDGINILTDPVWSERVAPVSFAGPRRHRPPGIRFEDLPPIDLVLVSHNHYDHLDINTLKRLRGSEIFTPLGNAALMKRHGISAMELDWWQSEGRITAVPSQHFSSRGLSDRNRNLWSGFVIASRSGNVYFAGDTGWGDHFAEIGRRFQPIRLALLPIGSYLPRWFMRPVHIDPAEAVEAHHLSGAYTSIAIHFGTFALGDDGQEEPIWDLKQAIAAKGNPRFWILQHGEGRNIPPID